MVLISLPPQQWIILDASYGHANPPVFSLSNSEVGFWAWRFAFIVPNNAVWTQIIIAAGNSNPLMAQKELPCSIIASLLLVYPQFIFCVKKTPLVQSADELIPLCHSGLLPCTCKSPSFVMDYILCTACAITKDQQHHPLVHSSGGLGFADFLIFDGWSHCSGWLQYPWPLYISNSWACNFPFWS